MPINHKDLGNKDVLLQDIFARLGASENGLTVGDAEKNLAKYGPNILRPKKKTDSLTLFASQFKSPIILILIFASVLSVFLGNLADATIILIIILASGALGFWQEKGAADAVKKLVSIIQTKVTVLRNGVQEQIPLEQVVPGDAVLLSTGDLIPGDAVILESRDLFVNESMLTGETYPVEKFATQKTPSGTAKKENLVFMGSHAISGTAKVLVTATAAKTEIGKISQRLRLRPPETEFERGTKRFGYFLMQITMILVIAIFAINSYFGRPIMDAFLFSIALAVGLTPQLLPAIIGITLSKGAKKMASKKVIVRRLSSIENLGSMNVLCCDKTGTITKGQMQIKSALDAEGNESQKILLHAYVNAFFETGFTNPIDEAIRTQCKFDTSGFTKLDEIPYDFIRKRLSILASDGSENLLVTKGALHNILDVCTHAELADGKAFPICDIAEKIQKQFEIMSNSGFRILGISYKNIAVHQITKDDECGMTFLGFLVFYDPLKPDITAAIANLQNLGVSIKIISGDNRLVVGYAAEQLGLSSHNILTGSDLRNTSDDALLRQANEVNVFAEIEPNQKERIINSIKKSGNVVGFLGDGINDAAALRAADVGISVDSAVDVAKEAADIVLLEKDLRLLAEGVLLGRTTFVNTLKYVFMATSANFGNMFSMAGASFFLPFLPLLPKQILLENLMTDLPELTMSTDSVDQNLIGQPRRWNIKFIRKFMMAFGFLSTVFDFVIFGLFMLLNATEEEFRTGWFVESIMSASMVVLIIRTQRPFFKSKPSTYLLFATLCISAVTAIMPFTPIAQTLGFVALPASFYIVIFGVIAAYMLSAEILKRSFYSRIRP